jgi:hypothetical protein
MDGFFPEEGSAMREYEMRQRVFRFLKVRMRNMIMPATLGLGLAVGSCSDPQAVTGNQDANDAAGTKPIPIYSVVFPDGSAPGSDLAPEDSSVPQPRQDAVADVGRESGPEVVPVYSAPTDVLPPDLRKADGPDAATSDVAPPSDQAVALDTTAIDVGRPGDAGADLGGVYPEYIAPIPDAGRDLGSITVKYIAPIPDAGRELGGITPDYIAQIPDAGAETPAVRYMAQQPDSGFAPVYTASQPS